MLPELHWCGLIVQLLAGMRRDFRANGSVALTHLPRLLTATFGGFTVSLGDSLCSLQVQRKLSRAEAREDGLHTPKSDPDATIAARLILWLMKACQDWSQDLWM